GILLLDGAAHGIQVLTPEPMLLEHLARWTLVARPAFCLQRGKEKLFFLEMMAAIGKRSKEINCQGRGVAIQFLLHYGALGNGGDARKHLLDHAMLIAKDVRCNHGHSPLNLQFWLT